MTTYDYEFLKKLGFTGTNIVEYKKNSFQIKYFDEYKHFAVYENDIRWMTLQLKLKEVFEVYSHYMLAEGHCICTGMGFLLRESWLLTKKEVTKLTVLEKNRDLIDYHLQFNSDIMNKINVVHTNAYEYKGKCDTLLLDNFQDGLGTNGVIGYLKSAKIMTDNIQSNKTWMWPLEEILNLHYKSYVGLSLSELYNNIKKLIDIKSFPDLSEEQLFDFCSAYTMGKIQKCDFTKLRS